MLMARMEPENNIEIVLDGFLRSKTRKKFVVVGNTNNKFGKHIVNKYKHDDRILFIGGLYDYKKTHILKTFSCLYFHGHSVGGTNPSLLEAMASKALIAAHSNDFNKAILNEDAYYFTTAKDVQYFIDTVTWTENEETMVHENFMKVQEKYSWANIIKEYQDFIVNCYKAKK